MKTLIEAQGEIQWWLYTVSHGQLLLRRPKTPAIPRRIDILFKNVTEVHLPAFFDSLRIVEVGLEDEALRLLSPIGDRTLYKLIGTNATGYIIAGAIAWGEDGGEYNEPSSVMQ